MTYGKKATVVVDNRSIVATKVRWVLLMKTWEKYDEIYNFTNKKKN